SYFGAFLIPFSAFLFGGLTNWIVLQSLPGPTYLIGVSGVVFWMGGAWLTLYFLIDRRRSWAHRALRSIGVGLLLFVPAEAFDPSISYRSHLIGLISGIIWAFCFFLLKKKQIRSAEVVEEVIEEPFAGERE